MMKGFTVITAEPGLLVLQVERLKGEPNLAHRIRDRFMKVSGIREVEADHTAGIVRVRYEPEQLNSLISLFALKRAFNEVFPEVDTLKLAGYLSKYL